MGLDYVRFDVGHYLHVCHKTTIQKYPNSSLVNYIKPEFDRRKSESDYIVIDRDGRHFGTILNFMRDERSLHLEYWNKDDITDLMAEADFYCLTELVELCDQQLGVLDTQEREFCETFTQCEYRIPKNQKVEIVFGATVMREVLSRSHKRVIVMSCRSMKRYHIDSWLEELVKYCDFTKVDFYCYSDRNNEPILNDGTTYAPSDFIAAVYDPDQQNYLGVVAAPTEEKFRAKRHRYKTKLLTFCFSAHQDNFLELMKKY